MHLEPPRWARLIHRFIIIETHNVNVEVFIDLDLLISLLGTVLFPVETSQIFLERGRDDIRMEESHVDGEFLVTSAVNLTQQTIESYVCVLVLLQFFVVFSGESKAADIAEAIEIVLCHCTADSLRLAR
ncbi:hypothetical protein PMAYCL1PPCAC_01559, partial [Pristionchus mayeri]